MKPERGVMESLKCLGEKTGKVTGVGLHTGVTRWRWCLPRTCAKTLGFLESVVLDWGAYEVCVWREGMKDLVMKWISKCMFMMQGSTMWILV